MRLKLKRYYVLARTRASRAAKRLMSPRAWLLPVIVAALAFGVALSASIEVEMLVDQYSSGPIAAVVALVVCLLIVIGWNFWRNGRVARFSVLQEGQVGWEFDQDQRLRSLAYAPMRMPYRVKLVAPDRDSVLAGVDVFEQIEGAARFLEERIEGQWAEDWEVVPGGHFPQLS